MNRAEREVFDCLFEAHYQEVIAATAATDPAGALQRTRAGFASAYRFWSKIDADDRLRWIRAAIDQVGTRTPSDGRTSAAVVDLRAERASVIALARRQRSVSTAVLSAGALCIVALELLVAHR
jgi:hypothetical protein